MPFEKDELFKYFGVDMGDTNTMTLQILNNSSREKELEEFQKLDAHVVQELDKVNPYRLLKIMPDIKYVIFNDPATIVFWSDGTKTVVKANNESFDEEKGMAMAISKRAFGNTSKYFDYIKKHLTPNRTEEYSMKSKKRCECSVCQTFFIKNVLHYTMNVWEMS